MKNPNYYNLPVPGSGDTKNRLMSQFDKEKNHKNKRYKLKLYKK